MTEYVDKRGLLQRDNTFYSQALQSTGESRDTLNLKMGEQWL